jgi:CRP/FNR family transcriptional regulator, cyclic AMP receptor protein
VNHKQDFATVLRDYFMQGSPESYAKGSIIIGAEDTPTDMYFIKSGAARFYTNDRGDEFTHIIYAPGEVFPLYILAQDRQQLSTCEALLPTEVLRIPLHQFNQDLADNNALATAMLRQTVEQYRIYAMRVANLEYKYASERLAYRLILLSNRFGRQSGKEVTINLPMTHQLLATALNLSRESVSREMEKLMRRGLVRYNSDRQIVLTDRTALSEQLRFPLDPGTPTTTQL